MKTMPKGIYVHTKEHMEKAWAGNRGKPSKKKGTGNHAECQQCGNTVKSFPSRPRKFCSLSCLHKRPSPNKGKKGQLAWNKGMKGMHFSPKTEFKKGGRTIAGENHHNWKGGVTKESKKIRLTAPWRNWRRAVFERDDYTCQGCGTKGCNLHPHHIWSFAKYPKYRFEEWNGQTLCRPCHLHLHNELGRN